MSAEGEQQRQEVADAPQSAEERCKEAERQAIKREIEDIRRRFPPTGVRPGGWGQPYVRTDLPPEYGEQIRR